MCVVKKAMATAAIFMIFSLMNSAQAAAQQGESEPQTVENVEALINNITRYEDQKVRVSGEVEKIIDRRSFLLESGGLFNNTIVVLIPEENLMIVEEFNVTVTGTVRVMDIADVEHKYGWELDPDIKAELKNVKIYLVADRIKL